MDPLIGTVSIWPMNWAPQDWLPCNGQLLPISQYQVIFALLGTTFGGDGVNNFGLPNYNGRVPFGSSNPNQVGQSGGSVSTTLTTAHVPAHAHTAAFTPTAGTAASIQVSTNTSGGAQVASATNQYLGGATTGLSQAAIWAGALTAPVALGGVSVSGGGTVAVGANTAGTTPVATLPPFQVVNYIICVNGIFPQRP